MSSWGSRWRTAFGAASTAAWTIAGERASASASFRRSCRYSSTSEARCVAISRPRSCAWRSTARVALRLESSANPVTRTRATAAPVTRKLCRSCGVRLDMTRVGSEATQGYPTEQACLISWTYESGADVRPAADRGQVAGAVGARANQRARPRSPAPAVLQPDDVSVPVGRRPARRQHVRVHGRRHPRAVPAAPGVRGVRADWVRRVRHPLRELRALGRYQSGAAHSQEHRDVPAPAAAVRRHVRLAARALDHRPALLQVDPVDLLAAL